MYANVVKPILDKLAALVFVLLFGWLYIILAILVRTKLGSPVLFKQERPGKIDPKTGQERIFELCKFRSMTDERDAEGNLLPDEVRLTGFGKFLRSTSLDELPEILFNILLRSDMSFVGPRPLLVRYLPRYSEEQRHRHDVKPGLTGYAQAHGRNAVTWEDKFAMDVWYVRNLSFATDVRVIADTIKIVLCREGISGGGEATMSEFMGTEATHNDSKGNGLA